MWLRSESLMGAPSLRRFLVFGVEPLGHLRLEVFVRLGRRARRRASLGIELQELDLELDPCLRRNLRRPPVVAVGLRVGNDEATLAPDLHADDTLVPAFDHRPLAKLE